MVNISKIFFLQIILNHITAYLKLEIVAYNNKQDDTYFIMLNRFPDLIASINSLLNQILIVPLHEVHMQYGSCKEHLYTTTTDCKISHHSRDKCTI